MRSTVIASLFALTSLPVLAADPPAAPAAPAATPPAAPPTGGPAFMASAPAADVSVEDADGGARLVFKAKDAKEVEALRAWVKQMADHLKAGCPMPGHGPGAGTGPGAGAGPGMGKGKMMQQGTLACPRFGGGAAPAAPATPAAPAKKKP